MCIALYCAIMHGATFHLAVFWIGYREISEESKLSNSILLTDTLAVS